MAKKNASAVSVVNQTPVVQIEPIAVDIPTAAKLLAITVWAMRQLIWQRKLPKRKIGKKFVILVADLRRFMQEQEV